LNQLELETVFEFVVALQIADGKGTRPGRSVFGLSALRLCCKNFLRVIDAEKGIKFWKAFAVRVWPHIVFRSLDWKPYTLARLVKVRESRLKSGRPDVAHAEATTIENCALEFEFKCPLTLASLHRTGADDIDYCSVCNRKVYICDDLEDLHAKVANKECVAFDSGLLRRRRTRHVVMGRLC